MPRKRIPNFNFNVVTIKEHQYYNEHAKNLGKSMLRGFFMPENLLWVIPDFDGD